MPFTRGMKRKMGALYDHPLGMLGPHTTRMIMEFAGVVATVRMAQTCTTMQQTIMHWEIRNALCDPVKLGNTCPALSMVARAGFFHVKIDANAMKETLNLPNMPKYLARVLANVRVLHVFGAVGEKLATIMKDRCNQVHTLTLVQQVLEASTVFGEAKNWPKLRHLTMTKQGVVNVEGLPSKLKSLKMDGFSFADANSFDMSQLAHMADIEEIHISTQLSLRAAWTPWPHMYGEPMFADHTQWSNAVWHNVNKLPKLKTFILHPTAPVCPHVTPVTEHVMRNLEAVACITHNPSLLDMLFPVVKYLHLYVKDVTGAPPAFGSPLRMPHLEAMQFMMSARAMHTASHLCADSFPMLRNMAMAGNKDQLMNMGTTLGTVAFDKVKTLTIYHMGKTLLSPMDLVGKSVQELKIAFVGSNGRGDLVFDTKSVRESVRTLRIKNYNVPAMDDVWAAMPNVGDMFVVNDG